MKLQSSQAEVVALQAKVESSAKNLRGSRMAFSKAMAELPALVADAHPDIRMDDPDGCTAGFSELLRSIAAAQASVQAGTDASTADIPSSKEGADWEQWLQAVAVSHNHMELLAEVMQM